MFGKLPSNSSQILRIHRQSNALSSQLVPNVPDSPTLVTKQLKVPQPITQSSTNVPNVPKLHSKCVELIVVVSFCSDLSITFSNHYQIVITSLNMSRSQRNSPQVNPNALKLAQVVPEMLQYVSYQLKLVSTCSKSTPTYHKCSPIVSNSSQMSLNCLNVSSFVSNHVQYVPTSPSRVDRNRCP